MRCRCSLHVPYPGGSTMMGWAAHFVIGAIIYGFAFANLSGALPGGSSPVKGIVLAIIGWLIMMIVLMPMMGKGLFAMGMGMMATVATLVLHIIFGWVLGFTYDKLGATSSGQPPEQTV